MEDRLTPDAVALYTFAVAHPEWATADISPNLGFGQRRLSEAIEVLEKLQLFRPSVDPSRTWDALSPDCALAELVAEEEADLYRRQAYVGRLRGELSSLMPTYLAARRTGRSSAEIDVVRDPGTLRQLLTEWAGRVREEVCVSHPGGGMTDAGLARSLERDIPVLRRGVRMRTLLQHSVRYHAPTRQYISTVAPLGAKIRTVPVVPRLLIMFDREIALVPLKGGQPENGGALIKEPALIDYFSTVFDLLWTSGRPFLDASEGEPDLDDGRDDLSRTILVYLAAGTKDDAIAHRLGMSVRTCRRHIAAIMERLHANSRFEAGVLAQRHGLLDKKS